ncbi:MAG: pilus assembly protein [Anaerolineae bacterium]|nr:pilus assembly protein [Anaerolineae bacterium]
MNQDQSGQSLLETAIVFSLLMLVVMGILGFGLIFHAHITLSLATNAAVRAGCVVDYSNPDLPDPFDDAIYEALVDAMTMVSPEYIEAVIIYDATDPLGPNGSRRDILDAAGNVVSSNYANSLRVMGGAIGVQVRYNQPVIVPFVSAVTGDQITIVKRAVLRLE